VVNQDAVGLVEQPARALEGASHRLGNALRQRRERVAGEGELVPGGPEGHLEQRERDDRDRHGLLPHRRLDPAEKSALVDAARRGERPDEYQR
jgi:hypothetical protein